MRRIIGAVLVALLATSLSPPPPAAGADLDVSGPWYGWLEYTEHVVPGPPSDSGGTPFPYDRTTQVRLRIQGDSVTGIRVSETEESGYSECTGDAGSLSATASKADPQGPVLVNEGAGPGQYTLDINFYVHQLVTDTGCGTKNTPLRLARWGTSACGFTVVPKDGFLARKWTPCQQLNPGRLQSTVKLFDVPFGFVNNDVTDEADITTSWNLVDKPALDPCLVAGANCVPSDLDGKPRVDVSPTGTGDLGASCGRARFAWRQVTGAKRSVGKGEEACVFLVGNDVAKAVLKVAEEEGVPIGKAFAGTILREVVEQYAGPVADWGERQLIKRQVLQRLSKAIGKNLGKFNAIFTVGTAVGLLAVPIAGAFLRNQIKNNDACLQLVVDPGKGSLEVDWSMVYAHSSDAKLTQAKVYDKVNRRLRPDDIVPAPLGMKCTKSGAVKVSGGGAPALKKRVHTVLNLR